MHLRQVLFLALLLIITFLPSLAKLYRSAVRRVRDGRAREEELRRSQDHLSTMQHTVEPLSRSDLEERLAECGRDAAGLPTFSLDRVPRRALGPAALAAAKARFGPPAQGGTSARPALSDDAAAWRPPAFSLSTARRLELPPGALAAAAARPRRRAADAPTAPRGSSNASKMAEEDATFPSPEGAEMAKKDADRALRREQDEAFARSLARDRRRSAESAARARARPRAPRARGRRGGDGAALRGHAQRQALPEAVARRQQHGEPARLHFGGSFGRRCADGTRVEARGERGAGQAGEGGALPRRRGRWRGRDARGGGAHALGDAHARRDRRRGRRPVTADGGAMGMWSWRTKGGTVVPLFWYAIILDMYSTTV